MKNLFIFLLCVSYQGMFGSKGEVFTAVAELERLAGIEIELMDSLEMYLETQMERLVLLKKFQRQLNKLYEKFDMISLRAPLAEYKMISRFVNEWSDVKTIVETVTDTEEIFIYKYKTYQKSMPTSEDLEGAAVALARIQDIYDLSPDTIIKAGRYAKKHKAVLNDVDTFAIGKESFKLHDWKNSRLWFQKTLQLMNNDTSKKAPKKTEVLDYLSWTHYMEGNLTSALNYTIQLLIIDPNHQRGKQSFVHFWRKLEQTNVTKIDQKNVFKEQKQAEQNYINDKLYFKKLCKGETIPTAVYQDPNKLKCWYKSDHPLLRLNPARVERAFLGPEIIIYRNFVSDKEMEKVIRISTNKLKRATVINPSTGILEYAPYRVSKSCWLDKSHGRVIETIDRRLSAVSGLIMDYSEDLQIQNYGIGGHYDPHFDYSQEHEPVSSMFPERGNRLATFLIYISEVQAGGATVFVTAGGRVSPSKGDAVFWYNLLKSGKGNAITRHAACPVLEGSKWVANKWVRTIGNEFTRLCGMTPDE